MMTHAYCISRLTGDGCRIGLKLLMTKATFVENSIMIVMVAIMLLEYV